MQRNWDTIRRIMLKLEAIPTESGQLNSGEVCGVDNEAAVYHMRLMLEAGLAVGGCPEVVGLCHAYLERLTWEGRELLDKIRRDTVWNKIKEVARSKSIDLSTEAIKIVGKTVLEGMLA